MFPANCGHERFGLAEDYRLADRRREVCGQSGRYDVGNLRTSGAAGLPLWRVGVFVRTLHPDIFGRNFIWRPGAEVEVGSVDFDMLDAPEFKASPLAIVFTKATEVRAPMDDPESKRFPIFDDMRAEGVTDYVALPILFIDGSIHASSWTTKQPGGFSEEQLNALRSLVRRWRGSSRLSSCAAPSSILLDTYVGNRAGERILGGQIRRGHTDTMHAAIWLSDLRGFTALSDRLPAETVVDILNQYFDCQVSAIREHGGEVLKFMGDGLLAVFPIDEYVGDVAAGLLAACWKPPVNPAPASRRCIIRSARPSSAFASASRCMSGESSTAISAAATGSTSPASVPPSILRRGWRRSPAASAARSWRREGLPAFAAASWNDLGEFPIAGFSKAERVYGLVGRNTGGLKPASPSIPPARL